MRDMEAQLRQGVDDLALELDNRQIACLLDYQTLIQKWNAVYNLTAVREPVAMLSYHLLDSLAVIAPLRTKLATQGVGNQNVIGGDPTLRLLDVGSGAGLPGVVIAVCCPDLAVDCVDAVAKKAAFIQQAAVAMRLPNLCGLHARVESLTRQYRIVSSRAFSSLSNLVRLSSATLAEQGVWLAMKGKEPFDEIAALPDTITVFHVEPLLVPGLDAERCIVWMRKT